ncbi:MAG: hypothetical protein GWO86_03150 [Planctomycetes bacterium]|nr:hypothetical protein [Planctomycetota bacterium]
MAKSVTKFIFAVITYCALALYLYWSRLDSLTLRHYLLIVSSITASAGAFVLSRRWIYSFLCSVTAGAMFGFGPFALGFSCYHPAALFAFALLPWLFCPAVFLPKAKLLGPRLTALVCGVLSLLPILITILFFELAKYYSLVPIPLKTRINFASLSAIITPLVQQPQNFLLNFFHVPTAALFMGFVMFFKARRTGVTVIFLTAIFLVCYRPVFHVPPVFWASIIVLYCAVLIGLGLEGLVLAGAGDSRWLLTAGIFSALLAVSALLLAFGCDKTYLIAAEMHALAALAVFIIYFITRISASLHPLRLLILLAAIITDMLITSAMIINKVF